MTAVNDLVEVRLLGLPLDLMARAQEHGDELRREFQHISAPQQSDGEAVPDRLLSLSHQLTQEYSTYTAEADKAVRSAMERGEASVDVAMRVPPSAAAAAEALGAMLDEADEFCRNGDMLTLATPPELVRLRRWYLQQFVAQIGGRRPVAWDEYES